MAKKDAAQIYVRGTIERLKFSAHNFSNNSRSCGGWAGRMSFGNCADGRVMVDASDALVKRRRSCDTTLDDGSSVWRGGGAFTLAPGPPQNANNKCGRKLSYIISRMSFSNAMHLRCKYDGSRRLNHRVSICFHAPSKHCQKLLERRGNQRIHQLVRSKALSIKRFPPTPSRVALEVHGL